MSNKGLTFIIIFLLLMCGATFGAFYLKTNPELALSMKIFGGNTLPGNNNTEGNLNSPYGENISNNGLQENTVASADGSGTIITDGVSVTPQGGINETVIPNTGGVSTDTSSSVITTTPVVNAAAAITQTLKVGSRGTQVKIVQQFLIDNKYLTGKADGSYGNMTAAAVKKFQAEYNLTADGVVTGGTRDLINELLMAN